MLLDHCRKKYDKERKTEVMHDLNKPYVPGMM